MQLRLSFYAFVTECNVRRLTCVSHSTPVAMLVTDMTCPVFGKHVFELRYDVPSIDPNACLIDHTTCTSCACSPHAALITSSPWFEAFESHRFRKLNSTTFISSGGLLCPRAFVRARQGNTSEKIPQGLENNAYQPLYLSTEG